ncbi:hypothetical protein AYO20_03207 [Fonsecaea nubica]|uniref:aldehyde dehydrogenase (NAD(+)) n=1 Tax=Fonsecaea nubica TaxID=856822 RepID=A0A178D5K8_9EURO|nr:hypothetical protein AYO20_03207 [Fonsecaea nubica]OAL37358.1 hypothetical protein AYO20_03207 [Fonsecaea nubica]
MATSYKVPAVVDLRHHYINGEYVPSSEPATLTLLNPTDGSVVTEHIPVAGRDDVDRAVKHAEAAFNGEWSRITSLQRSQLINRLADLVEEHLEDILRLDSLSSGVPISLIPKREKNYIVNTLRYFAGWCDKQNGDYFPADDGFVKLVRHEPLGVCVGICPFNGPVSTMILKVGPALATGNVIIIKPSEKTPLGPLAIAPLFKLAGIPDGVVQVLTGPGSTGALLAAHMRVRKVSFTGSVPTGKKIQILAAESNLKRVTLELGGKSPAVVFGDANIDNAVTWTSNGILTRTGQMCVAASRVYVQKSVAEEFTQKYVQRLKDAVKDFGDPQDPDVSYGPLVDDIAFTRVKKMIERGKDEARLVVGGNTLSNTGCFIEPTVFVDPKPDAQVLREEVFGPVAVVQTFETEDEVVNLANDTEYGLMAGVFTTDINRALRVSAKIDSGVVGINCVSVMNLQVPFGGKKASGIGREFGSYVLRAYTEPKTIIINMNLP